MSPFYQDEWATIYCGDSRDVLRWCKIPGESASVITDPVWPNAKVPLFGSDNPEGMLSDVATALTPIAERIAIHMGCDSDPRMLRAICGWDFFRTVFMEYACPYNKGRLLYGSDQAYLYGMPPKSRPGYHLIPGRTIDSTTDGKQSAHPCPRKLGHVKWLVDKWSEPTDAILDPFMGSGTTLLAAKQLGRRSVGIEINEDYCRMAVDRLQQGTILEPATAGEDTGRGAG